MLQKIISKTSDLFLKYGIKSISMDEISRTLGISKKTLYQFVSNKSDLVLKIMNTNLAEEKKQVDEIILRSDNAIDEMLQIFDFVCKHRREFNASVVYDLQKYYPRSWEIFTTYKQEFIYSRISKNLERGMSEGYYRSDMKVDIIAKIYLSGIDSSLDSDIFPISQYNFITVYMEYIRYHLRGIVSEKGLNYLNQHQPTKVYEKT